MDPATDSKENEPQAVVVRREPERDLVTWEAPSRPFKRRNSQFYVTVFSIAGIAGLVLFFAEGAMPVLLIISLVFLYYVLSTVDPEKIEYKITSKGIKIADKRTEWQFLNRFWFSERFGTELIVIETFQIPGTMEIVINSGMKDNLKKEISAYIPFEAKAPVSNFDKAANWFTSKLPGNE